MCEVEGENTNTFFILVHRQWNYSVAKCGQPYASLMIIGLVQIRTVRADRSTYPIYLKLMQEQNRIRLNTALYGVLIIISWSLYFYLHSFPNVLLSSALCSDGY